jgi:ribosome biogenesis protein ERB1
MDKPLTAEELDIIRRLQANEVPDANYDPYEPMTEWFTGKGKEELMPLSAAPEPKRRWVPSKWEKKKVCFSSYRGTPLNPQYFCRS